MAARTKTDRVTVRLPVAQIQAINALVQAERFRNTTDVIYNALKEFLFQQGTGAPKTIEAEKGLNELRKVAAEKEAIKRQLEELLNKLQ
jgi:Arc/MetJ-type ribon-helix-helix transcriptional regulator